MKLMLNLSFVLMLTLLFIALGNNCFGQSSSSKITIYASFAPYSVSTTEFNNFDISDWQNYGLKSTNPANVEGRVRVPLTDMKVKGTYSGALLGGQYEISKNISTIAEFRYGLKANRTLVGGAIGINYDFITIESFKLGITPKIGYNSSTLNLGQISLIGGYNPPVIIQQGTFFDGDNLSMKINSIEAQISISQTMIVTNNLSLLGQIGYSLSFGSTPKLTVATKNGNTFDLDMTDKAVVKSDLSGTQAGITPAATVQGLVFSIGIGYKL